MAGGLRRKRFELSRRPPSTEPATDLGGALDAYDYQPALTGRLDVLGPDTPFDQAIINEMVLWKVDRYVALTGEQLQQLNQLSSLTRGQHELARGVLISLLRTPGVDLAMASTFLRFRNPEVFQVVDRRAYRQAMGLKLPNRGARPEAKAHCYFDYLSRLGEMGESGAIPFRLLDRALYQFDKLSGFTVAGGRRARNQRLK